MNVPRIALLCSLLLMLAPGLSRAETDEADAAESARPRFNAAHSARQGLMFSELVAPGAKVSGRATAVALTGYDSARSSLVMRSFVDAHVYGRLDVRAGVSYLPNGVSASAQPHVGAKLRLLDQKKHGVDLGVGMFYRLDRFTADQGLVQGMFMLGSRFGRAALFANLAYGQDPEGDDREGQLLLGVLYEVVRSLQLGVESRSRADLGSSDPRRGERKESDFDATLTPTLSYAIGPIALIAQAGAAALHQASWRVGALAMAGIAAAY